MAVAESLASCLEGYTFLNLDMVAQKDLSPAVNKMDLINLHRLHYLISDFQLTAGAELSLYPQPLLCAWIFKLKKINDGHLRALLISPVPKSLIFSPQLPLVQLTLERGERKEEHLLARSVLARKTSLGQSWGRSSHLDLPLGFSSQPASLVFV